MNCWNPAGPLLLSYPQEYMYCEMTAEALYLWEISCFISYCRRAALSCCCQSAEKKEWKKTEPPSPCRFLSSLLKLCPPTLHLNYVKSLDYYDSSFSPTSAWTERDFDENTKLCVGHTSFIAISLMQVQKGSANSVSFWPALFPETTKAALTVDNLRMLCTHRRREPTWPSLSPSTKLSLENKFESPLTWCHFISANCTFFSFVYVWVCLIIQPTRGHLTLWPTCAQRGQTTLEPRCVYPPHQPGVVKSGLQSRFCSPSFFIHENSELHHLFTDDKCKWEASLCNWTTV